MERVLPIYMVVLAAATPAQLLAAQATGGPDARQQDKVLPAVRPATMPAAKEARRMSADGIEFPPAGERKFHAMLPVVRDTLGVLPEKMGSRVFHTKTSAAVLA